MTSDDLKCWKLPSNEGPFDFQIVQQGAVNRLDRRLAVCHAPYGEDL